MIETTRRPVRFVYGCYSWLALLACALPCSGLLLITPGVHRRRHVAQWWARLFLLAIGSPVRVAGQPLAPHFPCVVVANHASYLDGIILTAAVPAGFTYLIKREMARVPIAGLILRRLGSAFVDRADLLDRKRAARRLVELARGGDALGFFPEGTFDANPGLKPFHSGAFSAAARAKLPVVPVVIQGARQKLPAGALLPAPGPLSVRICTPVLHEEARSAKELMAHTRRAMLAELSEPDLAPADTGSLGADLDPSSLSASYVAAGD
jgi:1-acyl-sn-glycerol-3-phosphate acyltransferase